MPRQNCTNLPDNAQEKPQTNIERKDKIVWKNDKKLSVEHADLHSSISANRTDFCNRFFNLDITCALTENREIWRSIKIF